MEVLLTILSVEIFITLLSSSFNELEARMAWLIDGIAIIVEVLLFPEAAQFLFIMSDLNLSFVMSFFAPLNWSIIAVGCCLLSNLNANSVSFKNWLAQHEGNFS